MNELVVLNRLNKKIERRTKVVVLKSVDRSIVMSRKNLQKIFDTIKNRRIHTPHRLLKRADQGEG